MESSKLPQDLIFKDAAQAPLGEDQSQWQTRLSRLGQFVSDETLIQTINSGTIPDAVKIAKRILSGRAQQAKPFSDNKKK